MCFRWSIGSLEWSLPSFSWCFQSHSKKIDNSYHWPSCGLSPQKKIPTTRAQKAKSGLNFWLRLNSECSEHFGIFVIGLVFSEDLFIFLNFETIDFLNHVKKYLFLLKEHNLSTHPNRSYHSRLAPAFSSINLLTTTIHTQELPKVFS